MIAETRSREAAGPGADGDADSAVIRVDSLSKTFGSFVAVDGISFQVHRGEVFGILGPNGAGKTTTLEIIETLQKPTSGHVEVDGIDVTRDAWSVKQRIGVQLQSASFYPELTLVQLLKLFAAIYNVHIDPMAELRRFQLEDKAGAFYEKLSGGQKQRFALATTLLHRPAVIFLDEPTTGLDPQARLNLWDLIREIKADGITVVLTTHYMDEAEQLCDRVAIMDHGHIIKLGTPHALIEELLQTGFQKPVVRQEATLEDVFLRLTGRTLRDE
ncbi:MAG: ABC transporter ATP-binding protein [Candidatus Handelsmanbacteria bacterium RIFCSPLOWO2_12_FULL_64_10]|uniref:ABC transporter ATP-binding protein n=1 Tax=Handelsmanbacteria sp. (strain RIFCSPLOWO2_12_FULL_64_10) TaxID=1817868 RepID=A0A1F6C9X1_HANXR|nr:MAG: ABC transporter ATP-binding protein [Candidatus Handelsmanbacteria bacterium RIFCSPLOWO2_12_FULL_64_10]